MSTAQIGIFITTTLKIKSCIKENHSYRCKDVENVVQVIQIVEHSNGIVNTVAGGRRTDVMKNRSLPLRMHGSGCAENQVHR